MMATNWFYFMVAKLGKNLHENIQHYIFIDIDQFI